LFLSKDQQPDPGSCLEFLVSNGFSRGQLCQVFILNLNGQESPLRLAEMPVTKLLSQERSEAAVNKPVYEHSKEPEGQGSTGKAVALYNSSFA
jgi:hypothetical protein